MIELGALAALGSSVTWAYASARYAQASRDVGSQRVNVARAAVVLPLYLSIAFATRGTHLFDGFTPGRVAWLAASMFCSYALADGLFFTACRRIGISTAMAIASTYPLWAALAGTVFYGEPFGPARAAGMVLCVAGVAALVWLQPATSGARARFSASGVGLALVTSLLWACNSLATKRGGAGLDVYPVNAVRYGAALLLLLPQVRFAAPPPRDVPTGGWPALVPAILADAFLGSIFYVYALTHTDLAVGATLTSLAPLISVPMAIALGEERWSLDRFLAVLATVAGVVLLVSRSAG